MPSLREIRRKIKSVKSTQQITKAMKMVATARLRRAQQAILSARPFAQRMEDLVGESFQHVFDMDRLPFIVHPTGRKRLLVVVTSDKGLCGAFNTNLLREALHYTRRYGRDDVDFVVIGKKGRDAMARFRLPVVKEYVGVLGQVRYAQAQVITQDLLALYRSKVYVGVDLLYNEFRSVLQQEIVLKPLFPIVPPEKRDKARWPEYLYVPDKVSVLAALLMRAIQTQVFRVLLESSAAELGARMNAMENATRNATDLLDSLTLRMNRTRQASITNEILEVVSGAEALK